MQHDFLTLCVSGIKVDSSWTYNASFFYRFPDSTNSTVNATVSLVSSSTGDVFASEIAALAASSDNSWSQVSINLTPTSNADSTANNFTVTFDGVEAAGNTINFAMFSLFPPTFNNRENGIRLDLGEVGRFVVCLYVIHYCLGTTRDGPKTIQISRRKQLGVLTIYSKQTLLIPFCFIKEVGDHDMTY